MKQKKIFPINQFFNRNNNVNIVVSSCELLFCH